MNHENWKKEGRTLLINGKKIFYIDTGECDKPVLCILHGYPTSSFDFYSSLRFLSKNFRVILHDHPGFGLSAKPRDYSYSLKEQASVALSLWKELQVESAHIFAHDYGTSIATEIVARTLENRCDLKIQTLTLCNGSVHIELAKLRLIQKLLLNKLSGGLVALFSSQKIFKHQMRKLWGDAYKANDKDLEVMWSLLLSDGGKKVLPKITRYIIERRTFWDRWIGALKKTDIPVHILWGTLDPVAVREIAIQLFEEIKDAKLTWLPGLGHYPMMEDPEAWSRKLIEFISSRETSGDTNKLEELNPS